MPHILQEQSFKNIHEISYLLKLPLYRAGQDLRAPKFDFQNFYKFAPDGGTIIGYISLQDISLILISVGG